MKTDSASAPKETKIWIEAPEAQEICVAGTFNDWNPTAVRMEREPNGSWFAMISLPFGRHEYKFIVDGKWCCNPGGAEVEEECSRHVRNAFGTLNCVVDVTD